MIYGTVACLGDSLTSGARAEHDGHAGLGFPEWLPLVLDRAVPSALDVEPMEWAVLNRGIAGQTTRQILDRAPGVSRELASCAGARWFVLLAGTNDAKACPPLLEWETLYRQAVHWARRTGSPVILGTLPPIVSAAMPVFPTGADAWRLEANRAIRTIAAELDGRPTVVRVAELEDLPVEHLVDGVHLTAAGNREVALRVARAMTGTDASALVPEAFAGRFADRMLGEVVEPVARIEPPPARKKGK